jgi:hypothetical protein
LASVYIGGKRIKNPHFSPAHGDPREYIVTGGKYGYIDKSGKIIIKPKFYSANPFFCGWARVDDGYINKSGSYMKSSKNYDELFDFSEGFAVVKKSGKYGIIRDNGQTFLETDYDRISGFKDGLFRVKLGEEDYFIDKNKERIFDVKERNIGNYSEGLAPFCRIEKGRNSLTGMKWGYLDNMGNIAIEPQFAECFPFSNGRAIVKLNDDNLFACIDKNNNYIIKTFNLCNYFIQDRAEYYSVIGKSFIENDTKFEIDVFHDESFSIYRSVYSDHSRQTFTYKNGVFSTFLERQYYMIDIFGKINKEDDFFSPLVYKEEMDDQIIYMDKDGILVAKMDNLIGYINTKGILVNNTDIDYYDVLKIKEYDVEYKENLFPEYYNGKYGYTDEKGELVIYPVFDYAMDFISGIARIGLNKKDGYINSKGEFLIIPQFDSSEQIYPIKDRPFVILFNSNPEFVLYNHEGERIIPKYSEEPKNSSNSIKSNSP